MSENGCNGDNIVLDRLLISLIEGCAGQALTGKPLLLQGCKDRKEDWLSLQDPLWAVPYLVAQQRQLAAHGLGHKVGPGANELPRL